MVVVVSITAICLALSFFNDRKKTLNGIKKGALMFLKILPTLLSVIIIISVLIYITPKELLLKYFGNNAGAWGYVSAAIIGSISLIPGFIAYPLSGFLLSNGVAYPVIAIFITTLMMVGIATIPLEKKFFGIKVTLLRNLFSLIAAIIIGLLIGLFYSL